MQAITCAHCCSGPCQRARHLWDPASCLPGTCGYSTLGPAQQQESIGPGEWRSKLLCESAAQRLRAAILNTLYDQKLLSSVAGCRVATHFCRSPCQSAAGPSLVKHHIYCWAKLTAWAEKCYMQLTTSCILAKSCAAPAHQRQGQVLH